MSDAWQITWHRLYERCRSIVSSWVFHLFLSGIIMLLVFIHPPTLFQGDFDTALNYLNTIVSSLSTILALCISIILVAIQLTASNYTHRVLDYFVRLPYNGSLFAFYLVTIFRSFFLMSYIRNDPAKQPHSMQISPSWFGLQPAPSSLDSAMSADLVMVGICFIALLVYMYAVVQLLKPERIITLIVRDYDHAILHSRYAAALENVEQICDIAKRAASVSDSATGARCVEVMSRVAARLPLPKGADDPLLSVHQTVVDQWVEMVGVAMKERETALLRSVIDALHKQCSLYLENGVWAAAELVVGAYRHLVFAHLMDDGPTVYVTRISKRLYELGLLAAAHRGRGELFCLRTWKIIRYIGECAVSTQATGDLPLMEGFLMCDDVHLTVNALTETYKQDILCTYFELWKSFMPVVHRSVIARWAEWWQEAVAACPDLQVGYDLALGLAAQANRSDLSETMGFLWAKQPTSIAWARLEALFGDRARLLFDGWPWEALHAHHGPREVSGSSSGSSTRSLQDVEHLGPFW